MPSDTAPVAVQEIERAVGMQAEMGTADIVVGVLATLGVLVLLVVFVYVVKTVLLKKEE